MHPSKFDEITLGGERWPVTVAEIDRMRRQLARASANRTVSSWTNRAGESFTGNAFGFTLDDLFEAPRIYVYEVEDYVELQVLAKGAAFCRENQWGFEVSLHDWFLACPCRADDPAEAYTVSTTASIGSYIHKTSEEIGHEC